MLNVYYFTTTGWGGTGDLTAPVQTNTLWGTAQVRRGLTLDQCYNACNPTTDNPVVITPDPDAAEFRDANGFPLHTVVVIMQSSLLLKKSPLTLAGGAYRLRLDGAKNGVPTYYLGDTFSNVNPSYTFTDVDFVRMPSFPGGVGSQTNATFRRCLIAGCGDLPVKWYCTYYDSCFIGNETPAHNFYGNGYYRCSGWFVKDGGGNISNCININGLTQEQINAIGFVVPPKIPHKDTDATSPTYNKYIYEDGAEWSPDDFEQWDLRLKSTAPDEYKTGNALTSAVGVVYDLAGNKRKPGGALGAFECLTDVTARFNKASLSGWNYYAISNEPGAPQISSYFLGYRSASSGASPNRVIIYLDQPTQRYKATFRGTKHFFSDANVFSAEGSYSHLAYSAELRYVDENDDPINDAVSRVLLSATRENESYKPIAVFSDVMNWVQPTNNSRPNSIDNTSVFYLSDNATFADTASTVKKIIVPGWTHVDVGDVTSEIELGLGATVETSGKLTLKNETTTSADLLRRVQLRSPALLTLKDCNVSD